MKLESLCKNNGIDVSGAHSALFDANLTKLILEKIYREQNVTWRSALMTASRNETETLLKKEKMFTLNEYFYGKSRLFLCCPLHPDFSIHPVYNWSLAFDLKNDVKPLLNLSLSELKVELKKAPKFVRTIRSNKAPIILHANYGMKAEPYNIINPKLLRERAELILKNRAFAEKISTILREKAEEKQATKVRLSEVITMAKDFRIAFEEWVKDDRYQVGEDIGWEYADSLEADPTSADSSLTNQNGTTHSA